ncbi:hypothetical protein FDECE_14117 [Fusarium decemcellulare]|nr:hypothetical protein FDECE_14117 [Fusarium decemcellulare]
MEAVGLVASIIAISQLAGKVYEYIDGVSGASDDQKRLGAEAGGCYHVLKQLKIYVEYPGGSSCQSELLEALGGADGPLGRLEIALGEVTAKILPKPGTNRTKSMILWPFHQGQASKLINSIHRDTLLLNTVVTCRSGQDIKDVHRMSQENTKLLKEVLPTIRDISVETRDWLAATRAEAREHQNDSQQQIVLDWLTDIDYRAQQTKNIRQKAAGTGGWLLATEAYKTWIASPGMTLFCPGMPGAGKTILSSIVIDSLHATARQEQNTGVAYVYCDYEHQDQQHITDILSSLLKQLCGAHPAPVKGLYQQHKLHTTRPSQEQLSKALESTITLYSRVFIVIDALDELGMDESAARALLNTIAQIRRGTHANLFATSRKIYGIMSKFEGSATVEVKAQEEDVRTYLRGQMKDLRPFVQESSDIQNEIETSISTSVQGMFLLARLHFDSLRHKTSLRSLRRVLKDLKQQPEGVQAYDNAYSAAMKRIRGQPSDIAELGMKTLMWITCAQESLDLRELQHALAIEPDFGEYDEEGISHVGDIISACAGLVEVTGNGQQIRLVHFTTQEYLKRTQETWFPYADSEMTSTCVICLSSVDLEAWDRMQEMGCAEQPIGLYRYAVMFWGRHARRTPTISKEVKEFLKSPKLTVATIRDRLIGDKSTTALTMVRSGLDEAAYFGLKHALNFLLDELDGNLTDYTKENSLRVAVAARQVGTCEILLDRGVEIDCRDPQRYGITPLMFTVASQTIAELLIKRGADLNARDYLGSTALWHAINCGFVDAAQLLLRHDADTGIADKRGELPLIRAVRVRSETIIQLLLDHGADIDQMNKYGWTPLAAAIHLLRGNYHSADKTIARMLLSRGAEAAFLNPDDFPRMYKRFNEETEEAYECCEMGKQCISVGEIVVQWHIGTSVRHHRCAASLACSILGKEPIHTERLLEEGVDIEGEDDQGRTALSLSMIRNYTSMAQVLITKGANVNAKTKSNKTPLHFAAEAPLRQPDRNIIADHLPFSPHVHLALLKNKASTELLLKNKADPNAQDNEGNTPLHISASVGLRDMVRLLVAYGADVNIRDNEGRTPLQCALAKGHTEIAEMLRDA